MKHTINCNIQNITSSEESAWIITIAVENVPETIILLTALLQGKIPQIKLTDRRKTAVICSNRLLLDDLPVDISATWLEAILSMLLDIQLGGWTVTAHMDQDFTTINGRICVCFAVAPPKS
jgi:hypothetical protein